MGGIGKPPGPGDAPGGMNGGKGGRPWPPGGNCGGPAGGKPGGSGNPGGGGLTMASAFYGRDKIMLFTLEEILA